MRMYQWVALAALGMCLIPQAYALDYFELETYPYNTAVPGETEVEASNVLTTAGAPADGSAADTGLRRTSIEITRGLSSKTEAAAYLDLTQMPGGSWSQAGTRFHVRTRFFQKDELPVDLGLYAEVELPTDQPDQAEGELRGIIEKDFAQKWTFDLNPIFHKVLAGPDTAAGWKLQYATSLIYRENETVHPRLDLFGDLGYIHAIGAWDTQRHLLSPAVDWKIEPNVIVTAGIGFGLTPMTEHRLLRTRLEWEFY